MPKMDEGSLRAMLASQHASAMAASNASKLSGDCATALAYYNGDVSADIPTLPGRSSAVSMDVSDTIEGAIPQLMEVFCGSDDVVKFEPVGPEDVKAAEQETDYINHVLMNKNPGFQVIHSFIKDGLLSKIGIVKVWWEKNEVQEKETYYDKTDDEYALILASPDVEVIAHTENTDDYGNKTHDVAIATKKHYSCAKVMGVPGEEFGIEAGARNIKDCNYCFHKVATQTEADLIGQGFDAAQVKKIPSYRAWTNTVETNRDTVKENQQMAPDSSSASRLVEITEHYIRMDYEGDGTPLLYQVTTAAQSGEILIKDGELAIVEIDVIPFAAWTPIPMTHRFFGHSLADLTMDIQRIKTALLRGGLDSIYISLNPRVEVAESHASENTLDDLLVSRPNQIVRTKQPGGLNYQVSPDVSANVYPALEYFDQVREGRTGVSKMSQGLDPNALVNQTATAVAQAFSASQARMRLIARFAAEGIKDICWLLHGTIKKHADKADVVRLKNNWISVDPRNWKTRDDLTVSVGLGNGSRSEQAARLMMIGNFQKECILGGLPCVTAQNVYNTGIQLTKAIGHQDIDAFFTDPATVQQQPQKPDPAMLKAQADMQAMQMKAQLEQQKSQVDTQHQIAKTQADMALAERKFELDRQLKLLDAELKTREHQQAIEQQMTAQVGEHLNKNMDGELQNRMDNYFGAHFNALSDHISNHINNAHNALMAEMTAPTEIIRGKDGKATHVRKGSRIMAIARSPDGKIAGAT